MHKNGDFGAVSETEYPADLACLTKTPLACVAGATEGGRGNFGRALLRTELLISQRKNYWDVVVIMKSPTFCCFSAKKVMFYRASLKLQI